MYLLKGDSMQKTFSTLLLMISMSLILAACATPASQPEQSAPSPARPAATTPAAAVMTVFRSPSCGCCSAWVDDMQASGFTVEAQDVQDMATVKAMHNVPATLQSCHTALIDGYVIEGHVPAADIERLLSERPAIAGLAVPGMPVGSPGMEVEGMPPAPFNVVTFDRAGNSNIFASYPQ
jgi:hypothetical protein